MHMQSRANRISINAGESDFEDRQAEQDRARARRRELAGRGWTPAGSLITESILLAGEIAEFSASLEAKAAGR